LRLEAMQAPRDSGYEVKVSRRQTIPIPRLEGEAPPFKRSHEASVWAHQETIRSDRTSVDQALEQVLGFLEMRCA
jgi:hypothetical protein